MGLEVIINNYWNQSSRGAVREGWVTGPAEQRLSSCHHDTLHWSLVMTRMSWWEALRSGAQVFATGNRSHRERHVHYCLLSRAVSAKPPATNTKLKTDRQQTHIHTVFCERARVSFRGSTKLEFTKPSYIGRFTYLFCIDKEWPLSKWCSNKLRLGGYTPGWWLIWSEF